MRYWLDVTETIPNGVGFSYYDGIHLSWIAFFVIFTAICCVLYRRAEENGRLKLRRILAALVVGDELYKMVFLFIGGNYQATYLPLHLCSINILLIAWHACKPNQVLDNFLYAIGIPGAMLALFFPTWVELPLANFMHIHSFTVHTFLVAYPVMLLSGGDIKPDVKKLPKCILLLAGFALVALVVNLIFDTNFMFLMRADEGNPLKLFENMWGSHLWGFPVLIPIVLLVMYAPWLLLKKLQKTAK